MNYKDTIEYLYNQLPMFSVIGPGAYKPGLQTSHLLDDAFGNRHRSFRCIHVAGTNGKGSTSHSLASVLMAAGYKVGLYTSPHLADFRERIRVDGQMVSREFVTDFVQRYIDKGLDCQPSFFELTTIMAFDYFAQQKVDYAVIEVGLGGRLDTTNIITPVLSVITNVSLDHVALLGDTVEQIAAEKAGIMKPGVPVVIGEAEGGVRRVYRRTAASVGSPIVFAEDSPIVPPPSDLQGPWQKKNLNTVMHAIEVLRGANYDLRGKLTDDAVAVGLADVAGRTGLMGRWTILQASDPTIICDTGHNIGAWRYLAPRLSELAEKGPLRVVLGFANDKDVDSIFPMLPKSATYYFVTPNVKRARTASSLLDLAHAHGLSGFAFDTVLAGYHRALSDTSPSDALSDTQSLVTLSSSQPQSTIFIGGSNFVVAEIL